MKLSKPLMGHPRMLAELAAWRFSQMRALAPDIFAQASLPQDMLIVAIDGPAHCTPGPDTKITGALLLRRNGLGTGLQPLDHPLPAAVNPHLATGVRLPQGAVLCREVVLLLATARDVQTVIGFKMDRLTPFTADEVYWSISCLMPDRARRKLSLSLAVVLRAQVEALSAALARSHLAPFFIEAGAERIELATAHQPPAYKLLKTVLSALCGLLALACLATPFIRQQMAPGDAAQAIAAYAPSAHKARALHQRFATAARERTAIAQARHAGDALQVLAILTSALPNGTWLGDLTLKSGDLTFDGQSTDAAMLIGLLSATPGLRAPNFTAPVTRTIDGKGDLVSLRTSVVQ